MLAKKWLVLFALPLLAAVAMACGGGGKSGTSDQHWPHVQDFLSCVKSRKRCICDVETGHTSTVVCHLGKRR